MEGSVAQRQGKHGRGGRENRATAADHDGEGDFNEEVGKEKWR